MTNPVSRSNASFYDLGIQMSSAGACDPATASCGPAPAAPPTVTTPPVLIERSTGAQQLLEQLEQTRGVPDCSLEAKEAALSCAKAGAAAVAGGLSATTLVGALPAAAITLVESISCGKDLAAYFECRSP